MLAPPHGGSELADLLFRVRLDGMILGPVGSQLRTARTPVDEALLGTIDFELGVIAGDRPLDPIFPKWLSPCPNGCSGAWPSRSMARPAGRPRRNL
jgi:hypothetical protein